MTENGLSMRGIAEELPELSEKTVNNCNSLDELADLLVRYNAVIEGSSINQTGIQAAAIVIALRDGKDRVELKHLTWASGIRRRAKKLLEQRDSLE